jgi:hypothetical protein
MDSPTLARLDQEIQHLERIFRQMTVTSPFFLPHWRRRIDEIGAHAGLMPAHRRRIATLRAALQAFEDRKESPRA